MEIHFDSSALDTSAQDELGEVVFDDHDWALAEMLARAAEQEEDDEDQQQMDIREHRHDRSFSQLQASSIVIDQHSAAARIVRRGQTKFEARRGKEEDKNSFTSFWGMGAEKRFVYW